MQFPLFHLLIVLHAEYNIITGARAAERAISCRHKEQLDSFNQKLCDQCTEPLHPEHETKITLKVVGALRLRIEEFKLNYLLEKNIS